MIPRSISHIWFDLFATVAIFTVILVALGLMIGIVKPAELTKKLGSILGIVIALAILPGVLVSAWTRLSLLQQIAIRTIGVVTLLILLPARKTRHKQND